MTCLLCIVLCIRSFFRLQSVKYFFQRFKKYALLHEGIDWALLPQVLLNGQICCVCPLGGSIGNECEVAAEESCLVLHFNHVLIKGCITHFLLQMKHLYFLISAIVSATEHVQTLHIFTTETEKTQNEQVFLTSIQLCSCSVNMQATIPTFDLTFFF